ncbi:MAG: SgcJ/EcaC family oxidoreductase [Gemmatimonadaceae bacterium]
MHPYLGLSALLATQLLFQPTQDQTAIRDIVQSESDAWNKGDAAAYSIHFAARGTFTNIRGDFRIGYAGFLKQHEVIFESVFRNTTAQQDIVSLEFPSPDVAIVETLTTIRGITRPAPGMILDASGRLRTRLLQVLSRQNGEWKIVAYHNVDVKPGVVVPEPR